MCLLPDAAGAEDSWRFLEHVVEASTAKAQRLLEKLRNDPFVDHYTYLRQKEDTVQLLDALLYNRSERDVGRSQDR